MTGGWRLMMKSVVPIAVVGIVVLAGSAIYVVITANLRSEVNAGWLVESSLNAGSFLLACLAIGAIVGRFTDVFYAPPLVAIALALPNSFGIGVPFLGAWLSTQAISVPLDGFTPRVDVALHRMIATALLVALAAVLLHPSSYRMRPSWHKAALAGLGVGLSIVVFGLGWFTDQARELQVDPAAQTSECAPMTISQNDGGQLCVLPESAHLLAGSVESIEPTLEALSSLGVDLPDTWNQQTPAERVALSDVDGQPSKLDGTVQINAYDPGRPASIILPRVAACPGFAGETFGFLADEVVAAYIANIIDDSPFNDTLSPDVVEAVEKRQAAGTLKDFVQDHLVASLDCNLAAIPRLS